MSRSAKPKNKRWKGAWEEHIPLNPSLPSLPKHNGYTETHTEYFRDQVNPRTAIESTVLLPPSPVKASQKAASRREQDEPPPDPFSFLTPMEDISSEPLLPIHLESDTPHVDGVWDDDKKRKRTNEVC
jgi:hypothetical protein